MSDKVEMLIILGLVSVCMALFFIGGSERVANEHVKGYYAPVEQALISKAFRVYQAAYQRINTLIIQAPILMALGLHLARRYRKAKRKMDKNKLRTAVYTRNERLIMAASGAGTAGLAVTLAATVNKYVATTEASVNGYVIVYFLTGAILLLGLYWLILGIRPRTQYLFKILEDMVN
ncbi:hypothetical protein LCGC14_0744830 [marine sediment metagenome]|uniref:Uncharacterized protein n=1 Tax=marine sediment metagenome TaxID=412755 RepID=A0A0F9Q5Q3_9ZZZZ